MTTEKRAKWSETKLYYRHILQNDSILKIYTFALRLDVMIIITC